MMTAPLSVSVITGNRTSAIGKASGPGDSKAMLVVGLIISIPLIVAGASLIMKMLERFPVLIWAGAGLLGWLAGDMMLNDPIIRNAIGIDAVHRFELPAEFVGAIFVIATAYLIRRGRREAAV